MAEVLPEGEADAMMQEINCFKNMYAQDDNEFRHRQKRAQIRATASFAKAVEGMFKDVVKFPVPVETGIKTEVHLFAFTSSSMSIHVEKTNSNDESLGVSAPVARWSWCGTRKVLAVQLTRLEQAIHAVGCSGQPEDRCVAPYAAAAQVLVPLV